MNFHYFFRIPYILLLVIFLSNLEYTYAQNQISQSLWEGIGGKQTWKNTDFILFVATGNETSRSFQGARKFLINKANGDARFEGQGLDNEHYVFLFNYQTQKLNKIYKNKTKINSSNEEQAIFQDLLAQFNEDSSLLFIQTYLEKTGAVLGKPELKIINAEKLTTIPFKTNSLLSKPLAGKLHLQQESFQLRILNSNEEEYLVDGHKDIGGGLTLPTVFKSTSNPSKSCTYTLVASFTEMEEAKFTTL